MPDHPGTESLDAVIIGTGQAGKPLASALAEAGWSTAIIERDDRVGGTCIVRGCTPTKTMIATARVAHLARRGPDYGVHTGEISVDLEAVRERKRDIVESWSDSSREGLEGREGLELIRGEARFVGVRELEVDTPDGGRRRLTADRVFINTGARPTIPPIEGLEAVFYLDSTSIMELGSVPDHLVVLGGGFVGLEFAQMFRRFGSKVTILERGDRLIEREDEDISAALTEILQDDGIDIRRGAEAVAVDRLDDGRIRVRLRGGTEAGAVTGTHLLVAVGRTPNSAALDLAATGLSTDERGHIPVNARRETEVEGIWALGDVTGGPPFTHTSYDDFRIVRKNLLGGGGGSADDRIPTYVLFTDPQLGRVGLTETRAREEGFDVRVASLPMSRAARAMETDETRGLMKAVVDSGTDRILGAAVLGVEGGEIAMVLKTAMLGDLRWQVLRDAVYAHPTLTESLNNLFATLES